MVTAADIAWVTAMYRRAIIKVYGCWPNLVAVIPSSERREAEERVFRARCDLDAYNESMRRQRTDGAM